MISYVEKALNVRREEFGPASLLFLYLFLIIGSYIMGQAVGDALFLSAFPTYLPHVIIATAAVVGIFTSVYIRLSHRVRLESLISGSLLFFALGFVLIWWLARLSGKWAYPVLYTWVYMTGALGPTMGWTLANYALTTREARRVFGFIGAGAILGAPCAGFLTADLTHRAHVRPETLLLLMAFALGLCALSVRLLFAQTRHRLTGVNEKPAGTPDMPKNLREVWAYIRASRYLLLITALILVGCATTAIIGYQFKLIAYKSFSGDKVALAAFFGRFNGYIGLASFVLQMLLTGRLLRFFGIRVTLFVMPAVFLGGSMALLLAPALLTASILKGSQGLLRYSLDKSTTELLYLPVAPPRVKSQIKSFIDGFVWRMADGVAGITLFVFGNKMKFSPGRISLVNFIFLFGWMAIAYGVRHEYLKVLRSAIERRTLDPERTAAGVVDASTVEVLAQHLQHGGEQQVLYGLSLFEVGSEPSWHPVLSNLLGHPSAVVRQRALHLLAHAGHKPTVAEAEKMLGDEALEVRAEALQYLVVHAHKDPLDLLKTATDVPTHCLQAALVTYLGRSRDSDHVAAAQIILQTMLASAGPGADAAHREAARALGTIPAPSALHAELLGLLRHPSPEVVEEAVLSAGKIRSPEALPLIIESLREPRLVGTARTALSHYGNEAVAALGERLNDRAAPTTVRKRIPAVLARIGGLQAAATLASSIVQSDPELRFEVIKALNKINTRNPGMLPAVTDISQMLDYELLGYYRSFQIVAAVSIQDGKPSAPIQPLVAAAVRERMEQEFERVFRLLSLLYPSRDVYNAYVGLTSHRPQLQANALEVVEHLLPSDLYRRVITGVDPDSSPAHRLQFAQRLCHSRVTSSAEALRILLHSGDSWLCACALHTVGQAGLADLAEDVRRVAHDDPLLDHTWKATGCRLGIIEASKGAPMPTVLENVDLLRKAEMFQGISTQSLLRVAAITNEMNWAPGEVAYVEDTPAEAIYLLLEGEVELRSDRMAQRRGENQVIGFLAALGGGTHTESAVATQATRALRIDMEDFFETMAEDFNVTRGILTALAGLANRGA